MDQFSSHAEKLLIFLANNLDQHPRTASSSCGVNSWTTRVLLLYQIIKTSREVTNNEFYTLSKEQDKN